LFKPATPEEIDRARKLRAEKTVFEKRLWKQLRQLSRQGWHWRQQAPFRGYTLDFVEHGAKLVVELDGGQHGEMAHRDHDAQRDAVLVGEGYLTLRFWNNEVVENMDGVMEVIIHHLKARDGQE
jgi:adenine-specific DNA-methyltransferase